MIRINSHRISNISELLIIVLPISLLFSNIISETIIFAITLISFLLINKNFLKNKLNDIIFFLASYGYHLTSIVKTKFDNENLLMMDAYFSYKKL